MANYYNKDLYKILEVNYDASIEEIKLSYRKLVRIYHPDVTGNDLGISKFKEIQEAYEILTDSEKRKKYDVLRGYYKEKIKKEYESTKRNKYEEYIKKAKRNSDKPENFSKSINEALDNLFHSGKQTYKKNEQKQSVNGEDINLDLTISCFEALEGTNRKVNILHTQPCPKCEGRMFINGAQCNMCNGTGQISLQKKINVKIPAGVDNMSKIRVSGEGDAGINGGPNGDLYVVLHVKSSEYFKRDGNNVYSKLEISPAQAALGDEVVVKTLDGDKKITVQAGVQSGNSIKIKNAGVPYIQRPSQRGDHIVIVAVKTPTKLSEEERNLYKRLYEIQNNQKNKQQNTIMDKVKGVFQ